MAPLRWTEYYARAGDTPNEIVVDTVSDYVHRRNAALDLGAGNLRDSKYLLSTGFQRVVAVDDAPESPSYLVPGIDLHILPMHEYQYPSEQFDLAICINTLYFVSLTGTRILFENVRRSLKRGGVFACNLLGDRDEWVQNEKPNTSHVSSTDIAELCLSWHSLVAPEERERTDKATGKAWHTWTLILAKP